MLNKKIISIILMLFVFMVIAFVTKSDVKKAAESYEVRI